MRILVPGGTKFVGRSYVERALEDGHDVTLFNRGRTGPELFGDVEQIRGDRDVSLEALAGRSWDVVFDPSCYLPRHARMAASVLADATEHYTIVSSLSAYADETTPGQDESAPLAELVDPATEDIPEHYGALKVASERAIQEAFGDRALVLRPGFIGGPYDQVERMPWWLRRLAGGGEVLVPGEPGDRVQVIDARDIAAFALELASRRQGGVFNLCAPPDGFEMRELLDACAAAVIASDVAYTYVPEPFLLEQGVPEDEPVPYQPAAADRDEHGVGLGHLLREFGADRPLPGDHLGLVERVHDQRSGLLGSAVTRIERLVVVPVDHHDLGVEPADAFDLLLRRDRRHEDLGPVSEGVGREGDRQTEVPARCRDHAGVGDLGGEELAERASRLERARVLEQFELQREPTGHAERSRGQLQGGRAPDVGRDALACGDDVLGGRDRRRHGAIEPHERRGPR